MLNKITLTILLITGLMQNSFIDTMPDRYIKSSLFLVNRNYLVQGSYIPELDKITAYGVSRPIDKRIKEPLEELVDAAKQDGIDMHIVSAYRSFNKQSNVFNKKIKKVKSIDKALEFVALPGSSEHQLGICADVSYDNWQGINQHFENTKQGKWIKENCYNHGFIIRYLRGYEKITSYLYEPWHIRYIGKEHSQAIKNQGIIPLEFYVSRLRKDKYINILQDSSTEDVNINNILSK